MKLSFAKISVLHKILLIIINVITFVVTILEFPIKLYTG